MEQQPIEEQVRVLFHLNGYTKVLVERTQGLGLADGGIAWDIPTSIIPLHLRTIGSRFILKSPSALDRPSQIEIEGLD